MGQIKNWNHQSLQLLCVIYVQEKNSYSISFIFTILVYRSYHFKFPKQEVKHGNYICIEPLEVDVSDCRADNHEST